MTIHFIHTADLQIGKTFGQFPSEIACALRTARVDTLRQIALLARDRTVDAVLVAGDCFDDIAVSDDTLRRFKIALEPFTGTWIVLPGNHDPAIAESPWTRLRRLSLPRNVIIADEPKPILIGHRAVVLPAPLRRRRDAADLTEWFDAAVTGHGLVRIGLAHGSVPEFLPAACEAANPVALNRVERARLDYLALGDWHGCLAVSERAWYSGTPEPDRFRLNDPGYVLDVKIEATGSAPSVETVAVGKYRWMRRAIEIIPGDAEAICHAFASEKLERLVLRVDMQGTIDLATRASLDDVIGDLRARVFHLEVDESGLTAEPTDDDLDGIDTAGFVRGAIDRLREKPEGLDPDTARRALALLYGIHRHSAG